MKLAVFDFDNTLINAETIDVLARKLDSINAENKIEDKIKEITSKAMQGELDFYEALTKRVSYLKGLKLEDALACTRSLEIIKGAKECIKELKKRGYRVICFSGGFRIATDYYKDILGLDATFSNDLIVKNGALVGEVSGEMMSKDSKGILLNNLKLVFGLDSKDCVAIGDGANDISMFKQCDKSIAFCAKKIVVDNATFSIDKKDLSLVLDLI